MMKFANLFLFEDGNYGIPGSYHLDRNYCSHHDSNVFAVNRSYTGWYRDHELSASSKLW